jgi:fidgetin-like protein 1
MAHIPVEDYQRAFVNAYITKDTAVGPQSLHVSPIQSTLYSLSAYGDYDERLDSHLDACLDTVLNRIPEIQPNTEDMNIKLDNTDDNENIDRNTLASQAMARTVLSQCMEQDTMNSAVLGEAYQHRVRMDTSYPSTFQESIDFVRDLEIMKANTTNNTATAVVQQPPSMLNSRVMSNAGSGNGNSINDVPQATSLKRGAPAYTAIQPRILPQTHARGNENINNTNRVRDIEDKDESVSKKVNPFQSGRDMYIKDGGKFKPPTASSSTTLVKRAFGGPNANKNKGSEGKEKEDDYELPEELAMFDKALVQKVEMEVLDNGQKVTFEDIAGLEFAKKCVQELICWPIVRPDLFNGLRALPKGILLFGPPGTGKTLIGKAIAHEANATFFSISASSLMSKWIGEGERTVRVLFAVANYRTPSVVFLDEVDSLLCARSSEENEATRRMKTEFLVQLDGAGTNHVTQVVVVGASNRPEELDEAARRRFVKRIYIPLPDDEGRRQLLSQLLSQSQHNITDNDMSLLVEMTKSFSGADIRALCGEAAMGPMRDVASRAGGNLLAVKSQEVPLIAMSHFVDALEHVRATVGKEELIRYVEWNKVYGSFKNLQIEDA